MSSPTVIRRDGKLVLEIDERAFLATVAGDLPGHFRVVDRERFLDFVSANIFTLTHDLEHEGLRTSWWQRLTEALAKAAAATGQGVQREAASQPTCGCDPEEHDGG
jgi:hypothetical protein